MTQEEKQLLLKDLCSRLPYGVKCIVDGLDDCTLMPSDIEEEREIKPYLRPMSSMTEEEKKEYSSVVFKHEFYNGDEENILYYDDFNYLMDWLNAHHFDYRGLIEKGLAIAVTEENNPYKE